MLVQKILKKVTLALHCRDTVIYGFENNSRRKWCSRGGTRGNTVPLNIFGDAFPKDVRTRGTVIP